MPCEAPARASLRSPSGRGSPHVHAFTLGRTAQEFEPRGKAAAEVEQLYRWAITELHRRGENP